MENKFRTITMPPKTNDLITALNELKKFRRYCISPYHERFIFPFLCGSYFTYRKIDVIRIVSISKAITKNPTYLDVGCGYGDFLEKIRQYLPNAEGIEKSAEIFFKLGKYKPEYIRIHDAYYGIEKNYDVIFVGWMEPGVDYREKVAEKADIIITTLDQGISLAAEFDEFGFERIASWITPSWIDVNIELMNKYYSRISKETYLQLKKLRGAHNLWYVYSKPKYKNVIKETLRNCMREELKKDSIPYEFEQTLDYVGYRYFEKIDGNYMNSLMWQIILNE